MGQAWQRGGAWPAPALGALTTDGRVLMHVQTEAFGGPRVVRFLRHLLRHLAGKRLVAG